MPSIMLKNQAAGSANVLTGLTFETIPAPGALVSVYATCAAAGGTISYAVDQERYLVSAQTNIESSADVIDTDRDLVMDREPVASGQQFLSVDSQVGNVLVVIENLPG
jgi:hypothetical protein